MLDKYAKCRFRYLETIPIKYETTVVNLRKVSVAAFRWNFEYTCAWRRVTILAMVTIKCTKEEKAK
jgi:hypothetical protein